MLWKPCIFCNEWIDGLWDWCPGFSCIFGRRPRNHPRA